MKTERNAKLTNSDLVHTLEVSARMLSDFSGVIIRPFSSESLRFLNECSDVETQMLKARIGQIFSGLLEASNVVQVFGVKGGIDFEIECLRRALGKFNFSVPDEFFEKIGPDDVIELYDLVGKQLYRNFNFFKLSSYSLLDVLTFEWHVLYERAQMVTNQILETTSKVMLDGNYVTKYPILPHSLRERYLDGNRVFLVNMKHLATVFEKNDQNNRVGFIHCIDVTLSSDAASRSALSFI